MRSWVVLESNQACELFLEPDVHEQPQRVLTYAIQMSAHLDKA